MSASSVDVVVESLVRILEKHGGELSAAKCAIALYAENIKCGPIVAAAGGIKGMGKRVNAHAAACLVETVSGTIKEIGSARHARVK